MSAYLGFEPTKNPEYFFVSYNNEDAPRVGAITQNMVASGVPLWYDHGIDYGDDWETVITDRIRNAQAIILFFTKGILQKSNSYVQKEYRIATQFFKKKVYVVLLDEIQKQEIPVDKVAWWMEINEKQCLGGYTYTDSALLAKDIAAAVATGGHQSSPKGKRESKKSPACATKLQKRKGRGCLVAFLVTGALLLLVLILLIVGVSVSAKAIGDMKFGDRTFSEFLQQESDHLLARLLSSLLNTMSPSEETLPGEEDFSTLEPEPETEDNEGNHIYIPIVPGGDGDGDDEDQTDPAPTYTVSVYSNIEYEGNEDDLGWGEHQVAEGGSLTLNAAQIDGYNFEGWYRARSDQCLSKETVYELTDIDSHVDIEARYSRYTVTTRSNDYSEGAYVMGTYTRMDHHGISIGQTVKVAAMPSQGCNFEGWYDYDTGALLTENPEYEFVMQAQNRVLEARFSCYTVTTHGYNYEGVAGTYTEYESQRIAVGETVTLTATTQNGYTFAGWYKGDVLVEPGLTYTFTMSEKDVNVEARFIGYRLTVNANTYAGLAGEVTSYNEKVTAVGEQVTLQASVFDGFYFEGWYVEGHLVCADLTYTYTMKAQDAWIEARFGYYTLTTSGYNYEGMAGNYTQYQDFKVSPGKEITVSATVKSGYTFLGWYINGVCVYTGLEYTFEMPRYSVNLEAHYSAN